MSSVIEVEPASKICFLTSKSWWKMFNVCVSFVSIIHLKGLMPKHASNDTAFHSTFIETSVSVECTHADTTCDAVSATDSDS